MNLQGKDESEKQGVDFKPQQSLSGSTACSDSHLLFTSLASNANRTVAKRAKPSEHNQASSGLNEVTAM